jgi:hypothetical protein
MGFEPTIPTLERAKTVHDLDCGATVIGIILSLHAIFQPDGVLNIQVEKDGSATAFLSCVIWGPASLCI